MTEETSQQTITAAEKKPNNTEFNFRALEAKYQRELEAERNARIAAEKSIQESIRSREQQVDDEEDNDGYVDYKKFKKSMNSFGQSTQTEIQKSMEIAKQKAKEELRQEMWLENNPDFYDVLQHAEKFAQRSPKLADSILKMPEGFERQRLVYQSIKELGIDRPEQPQASIQDKIDQNRRTPYYQPSGMGNAPYRPSGDFSATGMKQAYEKLQQLKNNLRL